MPIPICCWPEKIKAGILCRDRIFCTLAEARVFFCKKITATAGKRVFVANIVFSGIISISEKKVRIMSKKANQKAKLLYLQQILLEETDEKHVLTVQQLIERLAELEIPAERKSLYDDIATLQAFGLDVIATRSRANIYRIGSRLFTLSELQLLAEAVVKSSVITKNKAQKLVDKLARLASRYQAETLRENLKAQKYDDAELLCPVELRCSNEIVPVVLDYLADSKVKKSKEETSVIEGTAVVDQAFYSWLFGLGNKVKLAEPANVKKDFVKYCKKVLNQYK